MRLDKPLGRGQAQVLEAYSALVRRWNAVARLVAKGDLDRFFARHLLDSLALVPLIRKLEKHGNAAQDRAGAPPGEALPVADFGSGAGLPGVPLAVALPELTFMLVERSEKKARFLQRVRDELTLPNVRVLCADIKSLPAGCCRGVVARAVMPALALWPHARAALGPGGYLLVLDRIAGARCPPASEPLSGFAAGAVQRHWVQMPPFGTRHGILEVREEVREMSP